MKLNIVLPQINEGCGGGKVLTISWWQIGSIHDSFDWVRIDNELKIEIKWKQALKFNVVN